MLGEGAGVVVLGGTNTPKGAARTFIATRRLRHERRRLHMTSPPEDGEGAARCMRNALRNAGQAPIQVQYINAHGTSTPLGDRAETMAIRARSARTPYKLAVSSTKSMTGHLLGAAGGVEAIYTALAIHHQIAPPTINLSSPTRAATSITYRGGAQHEDRRRAVQFLRLRRHQRHAGDASPDVNASRASARVHPRDVCQTCRLSLTSPACTRSTRRVIRICSRASRTTTPGALRYPVRLSRRGPRCPPGQKTFLTALDAAGAQRRDVRSGSRGCRRSPAAGLCICPTSSAPKSNPRWVNHGAIRCFRSPGRRVFRRRLFATIGRARRCWSARLTGSRRCLPLLRADVERVRARPGRPFRVQSVRDDAPDTFLTGVKRVLDYIRAGDVFQVNLSREWRARLAAPADAVDLYRRLRLCNPAPFAALMTLPDGRAVISSSPERLAQVRDGVIRTRPIAGTYPRSGMRCKTAGWRRNCWRIRKNAPST